MPIFLFHVDIFNEDGAQAMGKPRGKYITIEIPELLNEEEKSDSRVFPRIFPQIP